MNRIYLLLSFLFFLFTSCGKNYIFEKKIPLTNEAWTYADSLNFSFTIQDTSKIYNLHLTLEHATDYSFQNLYVQIHTTFPSGERIKEMVSLELANKAGFWFGDCNSEWCQSSIPIQEGAYFNKAGQYKIMIEQFMRKDPLEGVRSVGFSIEDTGQIK